MPGDLNTDGSFVFKKPTLNPIPQNKYSTTTAGQKLMSEFKKGLRSKISSNTLAKPAWGKAVPKT
jgi:hypothetical protein